MKKILVISIFVLLAAVNVAFITNISDGAKLTLNSLLKVAVANGETDPITVCAAKLIEYEYCYDTEEYVSSCEWYTVDCRIKSEC